METLPHALLPAPAKPGQAQSVVAQSIIIRRDASPLTEISYHTTGGSPPRAGHGRTHFHSSNDTIKAICPARDTIAYDFGPPPKDQENGCGEG